jgi:outer membrane immunogenic protein
MVVMLRAIERVSENTMRKFLQAVVGLLALGAAGPAIAADLAARPYTKAPAPIPTLYDWSGFYAGLNGGGGSSRDCWTLTADNGAAIVPNSSEGCHNATGGQIGYRCRRPILYSASKPRAIGLT